MNSKSRIKEKSHVLPAVPFSPVVALTLVHMGYFDYLFYFGRGDSGIRPLTVIKLVMIILCGKSFSNLAK